MKIYEGFFGEVTAGHKVPPSFCTTARRWCDAAVCFHCEHIRFAKHMVCSDLIGSRTKISLEKYKVFRILNHPDLLSIKVHEAIGSCELLHADLWTA